MSVTHCQCRTEDDTFHMPSPGLLPPPPSLLHSPGSRPFVRSAELCLATRTEDTNLTTGSTSSQTSPVVMAISGLLAVLSNFVVIYVGLRVKKDPFEPPY